MESKSYPAHILPKEEYHKIACKNILAENPSTVIGRRFDGVPEKFLDLSLGEDFPRLKDNWIKIHEIRNLSTCLLGASFQINDFNVIQKDKGDVSWEKGSVDINQYSEGKDYIWVEGDFFVIVWPIIDIENKDLTYPRIFEKERDYKSFCEECKNISVGDEIYLEEYAKLPKNDQKKPFVTLKGKVRVNHDPKMLNFWHFTIDFYSYEHPDIEEVSTKRAWQRAMAENIKDILENSFEFCKKDYEAPLITNIKELMR